METASSWAEQILRKRYQQRQVEARNDSIIEKSAQ